MNPTYDEILGEKCYKALKDIPDKVEVVDCFRKSAEIPAIADDAIAIGAKVLWMQLGVENAAARSKAEAAGLEVIENRCMKIEHGRFFGGLGLGGREYQGHFGETRGIENWAPACAGATRTRPAPGNRRRTCTWNPGSSGSSPASCS